MQIKEWGIEDNKKDVCLLCGERQKQETTSFFFACLIVCILFW